MLAKIYFALFAFSGDGGNGGLLSVNPGLIIWTVVIFLILLFILWKMAWNPILGALGDRENFIKDSLDRAEKAKEEAEKVFEKNQEQLNKAESEVQKLIEQGREDAEKIKDQLIEKSKQEAKKLIDNATAEIERKNQEAFNQLRGQIVDISISAAEKILRENLDKEKQTSLVSKFIDDMRNN